MLLSPQSKYEEEDLATTTSHITSTDLKWALQPAPIRGLLLLYRNVLCMLLFTLNTASMTGRPYDQSCKDSQMGHHRRLQPCRLSVFALSFSLISCCRRPPPDGCRPVIAPIIVNNPLPHHGSARPWLPGRRNPHHPCMHGNCYKEQNMMCQAIGFNWGAAGVSTSVWRGARLRDVLRRCGIMGKKDGPSTSASRGSRTCREAVDPSTRPLLRGSSWGTCMSAAVASRWSTTGFASAPTTHERRPVADWGGERWSGRQRSEDKLVICFQNC